MWGLLRTEVVYLEARSATQHSSTISYVHMQAAKTVPTTLKAERWRKLPGLVIFCQLEIFEPTEAMHADNTLVHLLTIKLSHLASSR